MTRYGGDGVMRKLTVAGFVLVCVGVLLIAHGLLSFHAGVESQYGRSSVGLSFTLYAEITFASHGRVIYHFSGLDPLTNLGLNLTFAKLSGSAKYNQSQYSMNAVNVGLGYNTTGALSATNTTLAGEFIRMAGTVHAQVYDGYNLTAVFSGFTGSNSSNCMGIFFESSTVIGYADLFAWTVYSLVTGIDSSFTVTAELQIKGTTS